MSYQGSQGTMSRLLRILLPVISRKDWHHSATVPSVNAEFQALNCGTDCCGTALYRIQILEIIVRASAKDVVAKVLIILEYCVTVTNLAIKGRIILLGNRVSIYASFSAIATSSFIDVCWEPVEGNTYWQSKQDRS